MSGKQLDLLDGEGKSPVAPPKRGKGGGGGKRDGGDGGGGGPDALKPSAALRGGTEVEGRPFAAGPVPCARKCAPAWGGRPGSEPGSLGGRASGGRGQTREHSEKRRRSSGLNDSGPGMRPAGVRQSPTLRARGGCSRSRRARPARCARGRYRCTARRRCGRAHRAPLPPRRTPCTGGRGSVRRHGR